MKKIMILVFIVCLTAIGCTKSLGGQEVAANIPIKSQRYIGSFKDNVNICRKHGDIIEIQREREESFAVYKLDMNTGDMSYQYTGKDDKNLLFYKQIYAGNALEVKRLGNSEEDNILVLKGKKEKVIGKNIAYSDGALVSTSPSERYVIYCAAEAIINQYGLYVYDIEKGSTLQLVGIANEELLNDMEWSISWSQNEEYISVSNKLILNVSDGSIVGEINASAIAWSQTGSKIAYINAERTLCTYDITKGINNEVFVSSEDEYLPGYIVWSQNETKLAIVTSGIDEKVVNGDISTYKAMYSLDLVTKEAIRIDTLLQLEAATVAQIENISYNSTGKLFSFTCSDSEGSNLHVYNIDTSAYEIFMDVEYLHYENNESYVCTSKNKLYFIQDESLIELKESLETEVIKSSDGVIDDIYISEDGNVMIIAENQEESLVLRQISNFSNIMN
ncbi:MAG: hypothetical protein WBL93_03875 [Lutisporaceae bacterium]